MAKVPYTPDGYHTVTAYLTLRDAVAAVDFYRVRWCRLVG
jgi:hypothetical protein